MLLQMGQYEYDSIIYALTYAIKDLEGMIESGKAKPEYFSDQLKSMKETKRHITDFWNADKD